MDAIISIVVPYTMATMMFAFMPLLGAVMAVMVQFIVASKSLMSP